MKKFCKVASCSSYAETGSSFCAAHKIRFSKEHQTAFDQRRGTSSQRGYDFAFRKMRNEYMQQHPTCAECGNPSIICDHIVPVKADPSRRLDRTNFTALCRKCHAAKTIRDYEIYPDIYRHKHPG